MEKNRVLEIDLLRGLAIILVVLGHSFIVYPIDISTVPWCKAIDSFIDTFHMETFFVLSGLCYSCKSYIPFIIKKIKRIGIPYLAFGCVALVLHAWGGVFVNNHGTISSGLIKLLHGGNYWFLYTLFAIFLIYPLIDIVLHKRWQIAILLVLLMIIGNTNFIPYNFQIKNIVYHFPYFIVGALLKERINSFKYPANARVLSVLLLIVYAIIQFTDYRNNMYIGMLRYIQAFAMIAALYMLFSYYITTLANSCAMIFIIRQLCMFSKYSLQIYLLNGFLLVIMRSTIINILHIYDPFVIVAGILIGDLLLSILVCKIVERIKPLRVLLGL